MKNKKTLLSIVLVFVVLMGGAYVLYDRLGRNVGTEQMIVHADQQPAASAATEGDSADTAGEDESASAVSYTHLSDSVRTSRTT